MQDLDGMENILISKFFSQRNEIIKKEVNAMLFASRTMPKAGCLSIGLLVCGTVGINISKFSG